MESKNIPTSVYAEITPNPNTVKFVANRAIMPFAEAIEFKSAKEAMGHSTLASQLFNFPFVSSLFFSSGFVSVTKTGAMEWDLITMQLREFIQEFLQTNEWAVQSLPEEVELPETQEKVSGDTEGRIGHVEPKTEVEGKIIQTLDEYIRPAVESDGGAIDFRAFENGRLEVTLRGSCSGCPSSVVTLKNGIETLMGEMVPEVKEVVAFEQ